MADPSSMLVTETVRPLLVSVQHCALQLRTELDLLPALTCSTCCLLGILYCFWGYCCFRLVMFVSGCVLSVCVSYPLCKLLAPDLELEMALGVCLGVALLVGMVTALVRSVAMFLSGLQLGLLLSVAALLAVGQYYALSPLWVPLGVVIGTAVSFAVLTLLWQKPLVLVSTATLGAAMVTAGVDVAVEARPLLMRALDGLEWEEPEERRGITGAEPHLMCWYTWVMLGAWPVLTLLGVIVQWRLTAYKLTHMEVCVSHHQKQLPLMQIRQREARRRPQGVYRRRPPPLKRYAGDVLAPSYLRHLQERQSGTGSSQSSLSTTHTHHTMIDFDYETGSMVPLTSPSSSSSTLRI
ncbi:transmembrane protein 198-like [Clupea harengus]|uniref:Transmembrane protein 198 n=1 Tax=Clupea harengus TaxID=7950 RepID=A0A6P3VZ24_CLUHA|nr:transmembrane protein 198-like [Clupea harengus]